MSPDTRLQTHDSISPNINSMRTSSATRGALWTSEDRRYPFPPTSPYRSPPRPSRSRLAALLRPLCSNDCPQLDYIPNMTRTNLLA